ncbi:uracil DNA glycosylase [Tilletia horrida]|nr:uracil DNA glycosylase [Tilletia horrida]
MTDSIASSRPKRAASSSPTKSAPSAVVAKKPRLGGAAPKKDTAPVPAMTSTELTPATTAEEVEIEDAYDAGDLDTDLLLEVAEQAEKEAALEASNGSTKTKNGPSKASTAATTAAPSSALAGAKGKVNSAAAAPPTANVAVHKAAALLDQASNLHSDDEVHTMEVEWRQKLQGELKKEYYIKLKQYIANERKAGKVIYPPTHLVHSWSKLTPLRSVKVVVVGQDPYHGPGQACGHSFSVPKGIAVPASLQNIYKELKSEYPQFTPPKHGCLDGWARQGVLLLNACLTVAGGQAGSHHGKGWETFTRVILKMVADEAAKGGGSGSGGQGGGVGGAVKQSAANPFGWSTVGTSKSIAAAGGKVPAATKAEGEVEVSKESSSSSSSSSEGCKGVVFLVWGQPAAKTVAAAGVTEKCPNVLILRSPHPSPLSAHRGFLGNGHFKKANEWLETVYGPGGGIDWSQL